ncbi:MAG: ferrous iron efflux protein F [Methanocella sp. PtaU1.Bin125]|nr:MAG: ferrous iron efflux protein F [Methanocella sp. PtaU1.Bin125]
MQAGTPEKTATITRMSESRLLRVASYSLIINIGLVLTKLGLSIITGSLALRADGIHSFVDVIMSVALIVGILISSRKSRQYPYGLYKVENIVSIVIAFLVFLTAYEIVIEALSTEGMYVPYGGWVLAVVALIIPVPYLLGAYEVRVGKKYFSPSLIADGKQHKVDVLTSSIVFFALIGQYLGYPLDHVAAIIIAIFVFHSGWGILKDSMRTLLDASVDYPTLDRIRSIIRSDPMVKNIVSVTGRSSGRYIFVEAIVTLTESDFDKAHHASERIEGKIREQVPNVDRVLIHYEPEEATHLRYAVPLQDRDGTVSPHFGDAPYFAFIDFNAAAGRFEKQEIIPNEAREEDRRKGILVAKMLLAHRPDIVLTRKPISEKGPECVLQAANIEVRETGAETVAAIIRQVEQGLQDGKASEEP